MQKPMHKTGFAGVLQNNRNAHLRSPPRTNEQAFLFVAGMKYKGIGTWQRQ